jgi:rhodanese-related sulfurtransferase
MEFIKQYWPMILFVCWMAYKWLKTQKLKKRLPDFIKNGAILVDVRSSGEYASAHAKGSINIPLDQLQSRIHEIPKSTTVLVACASGSRSGMARLLLKKSGHKEVYNMGNWKNLEIT